VVATAVSVAKAKGSSEQERPRREDTRAGRRCAGERMSIGDLLFGRVPETVKGGTRGGHAPLPTTLAKQCVEAPGEGSTQIPLRCLSLRPQTRFQRAGFRMLRVAVSGWRPHEDPVGWLRCWQGRHSDLAV